MKALASVACVLVATTPAAADKDKKYTLADLKALVKDKAYKEAVVHLGDVAPSERTAEWQDIAEEYDYVWAYNVAKYAPQLQKIGEVVFKDGNLTMYRIKKPKEEEDSGQ